MQETKKELTPLDVHRYFELYKIHMDEIRSFEEKLYSESNFEKWLENYKKRSSAMRNAFVDNTRIDAEIGEYLKGNLELTDELAGAFYAELLDLNLAAYDDPFYAVHFCNSLINFYEKKNNLSRLCILYVRLGWEAVAAFRIGYRDYEKIAFDAYSKVLSHLDEYGTFADVSVRRTFFVAFHNMICVLPQYNILSIEKAMSLYNKMMKFYESSPVQAIDANTPAIREIIDLTKEKLLSFEGRINECRDKTRMQFCEIAREVYKDLCDRYGSEYKIPVQPLLANYRALIMENRCSYSEALEYLLAYYDIRKANEVPNRKRLDFGADDEFYFETLFPDSLIFTWLKDPRVSRDVRDRETNRLIKSKYAYFEKVSHTNYTPFMNYTLTAWCFDSLNLLDSFEEKERAILNIVLNRQIQTFFHSHMVASLSCSMLMAALRMDPLLFSRIYPGKSAEEIRSKAPEMIAFITKAALFHDIGKNRIANVINMQHRKLTKEEIYLIRRHPGIGVDSVDEAFDAYYDVILGHHKYFDGRNGYPDRYDSSNSRVKPYVDIISICDSLDAATDKFGRNYASAKSFETVLSEFKEGAGTKYNPAFVELMYEDRALYNELEAMVTDGRENLYFELVKTHLQGE